MGGFFVAKKDGVSLRLVIDSRVPNSMHQRPPRSSLATPASVARLNTSPEMLVVFRLSSVIDRSVQRILQGGRERLIRVVPRELSPFMVPVLRDSWRRSGRRK